MLTIDRWRAHVQSTTDSTTSTNWKNIGD